MRNFVAPTVHLGGAVAAAALVYDGGEVMEAAVPRLMNGTERVRP